MFPADRPAKSSAGFWKWIMSRSAEEDSSPWISEQDRILRGIFRGVLILGTVVMLLSAGMVIHEGKWGYFFLIVSLYGWVLVLTLRMNSISRKALSLHVCSLAYTLSAGTLFLIGPTRAGLLYLFAFQLMAAGLMGLRGAKIALGANIAALAAVAIALSHGRLTLAFPVDMPVLRWMVLCANFLFVTVVATLIILSRNKGMLESLDKERDAVAQLQKETAEKEAANLALKASESQYRQLLENISEVVFSLDSSGVFTYVSPGLELVTGYRPAELVGRHFSEFVQEEDRRQVLSMVDQVFQEGKKNLELRILKKDGEVAWISASASPLRKREGLGSIFGLFADITEKRMAEEEREVLKNRLAQAQKMEAVGRLAGGIAHDFNNILSPILGYAEMLLQDYSHDPAARDNLREVVTAATRAKDLVRQVLLYGSKAEDTPRPMDLGKAIEEARKLLNASKPPSVRIQCRAVPRTLVVNADPVQIHRVVLNLCTNAFHAMKDKGGALDIELGEFFLEPGKTLHRSTLKPGAYACLSVKDQGHGMNPEILDKIFEPYFTTKDVGEGSGIGLAAAHSIVTRMGGDILVSSQPGEGSCFCVYMPLLDQALEPLRQTPATLPTGSERILLVEDEEQVLHMTSQMLSRLGYKVTSLDNAAAALDVFRVSPHAFDLLITDLTMPGMTGDQLARMILQLAPGFPIIVCTGFTEILPEEKRLELGVAAVMKKPVNMAEMADTVARVLKAIRVA